MRFSAIPEERCKFEDKVVAKASIARWYGPSFTEEEISDNINDMMDNGVPVRVKIKRTGKCKCTTKSGEDCKCCEDPYTASYGECATDHRSSPGHTAGGGSVGGETTTFKFCRYLPTNGSCEEDDPDTSEYDPGVCRGPNFTIDYDLFFRVPLDGGNFPPPRFDSENCRIRLPQYTSAWYCWFGSDSGGAFALMISISQEISNAIKDFMCNTYSGPVTCAGPVQPH